MTGDLVNTKWNANSCDEWTFDSRLWLVSAPGVYGETHLSIHCDPHQGIADGMILLHAVSMVLGKSPVSFVNCTSSIRTQYNKSRVYIFNNTLALYHTILNT